MKTDPFFMELVESFRSRINSRSASLYILDETERKLFLVASAGYPDYVKIPKGYSLGENTGLAEFVFKKRKVTIVDEPKNKIQIDDSQYVNSVLSVPLISKSGDIIGLLKAENKMTEEELFVQNDIIIAESFGSSAAIALEIQQKSQRLRKLIYSFVLMPFDPAFDDIYEYGIKGTVESLGITCERVDEIQHVGGILDQVFRRIEKSRFIIADMTGRNPNVYYEVGYAHALKKDVILLTQSADDIPFDLRGFNHIVYNGKISVLKESLIKMRLYKKSASLQVQPRLTKRAPDVWDSAAFSSIFLASSFSYSQALSTPAHTQVTQTVSHPLP